MHELWTCVAITICTCTWRLPHHCGKKLASVILEVQKPHSLQQVSRGLLRSSPKQEQCSSTVTG